VLWTRSASAAAGAAGPSRIAFTSCGVRLSATSDRITLIEAGSPPEIRPHTWSGRSGLLVVQDRVGQLARAVLFDESADNIVNLGHRGSVLHTRGGQRRKMFAVGAGVGGQREVEHRVDPAGVFSELR